MREDAYNRKCRGKSWILHQSTLWHEWDLWLNVSETDQSSSQTRSSPCDHRSGPNIILVCRGSTADKPVWPTGSIQFAGGAIQLWPSKRGGRLPAEDRIDGWEKPPSGTKGAGVTGGRCPRQIAALESECGKGPMGEKMFSSQQEKESFTQRNTEGKQEQCRALLRRSSTSLT